MARVDVEGTDLVVRLSWPERMTAGRREVRVPAAALRRVYVEPDWWRALRGRRGRGLWIPGRYSLGTRRLPDGEDFTALRAGGPVLCVDLSRTSRLRRLALSVPAPDATARRLEAALLPETHPNR
jgi:hypothetical protein